MTAAAITSKPRETIVSKLIFCCFVIFRATEICQYKFLTITQDSLRMRGVTNVSKIISARMLAIADAIMPGS
jgi:hypothetical protein